jgi:hypothetical protein
MTVGTNFLELEIEEVITKIQMLSDNKEVVKIWTKGNDSSFYRLCDLLILKGADKSDVLLSFFSEGEDRDATLIGKKAFISFHFNEIDYFAEGMMIKDEAHDKIILRLEGKVYRSEKRDNERLITFPHHQVYAYFKIIQKEETNVVSIKRSDEKEYKDFKVQQKTDLKEKLSRKIDDLEDLVGFRTLDISKNGIAFVVGNDESIHFKEEKKLSFYILFNSEVFLIKGAKLVYKVNYLSGVENQKRLKIGLTYNPSEKLTNHLSAVLSKSSSPDLTQKEFEDFIDT